MLTTPKVDIERFNAEGYLVVEDVLDPTLDIEPIINEYSELLDSLAAKWHAEGKIPSAYADLPLGQRLARLITELGVQCYQYLDISLTLGQPEGEMPMHLGPAVFNLLRSPRMLDVVEQFIGPEIYSNPIQHVRIKPPESLLPELPTSTIVTMTDWHQDQGVALPEVDETDMLTAWVAIGDATEENGCLSVIPGSHRGGLATHCSMPGKALHIPDKLLAPNPIPVPVKRGGVLFMHRLTMHSSLRNLSNDIRWSFDLRYQPIGQPTGRPAFPGFIARSKQNPANAITGWHDWAQLWYDARAYLAQNDAGPFRRWTGNEPACA